MFMRTFFFVMTIVSMIAVLATLAVGLVAMTRGGTFNDKYGNKLMRARVMLQGLALLFFAAAMMS
ncbi:MAG: twin transmembrane helix small protein [Inquilinaceae bacterium]